MLKNQNRQNILKNEKGIAIFEMLPMLVIFVLLTSFMMGFFGVVQTAILQSIASRNYAFETFRNRTNLTYFRTNRPVPEYRGLHYRKAEVRIHATSSEKIPNPGQFYATTRKIDLMDRAQSQGNSENIHAETIPRIENGKRWQNEGANPVWVRVSYGICLNLSCGDT